MDKIEEDKVYFQPGDIVTLKQDIQNKPEMIVFKKSTLTIRSAETSSSAFFKGMICRWFTKDGQLQEATFNTKDLQLIKINL